MTVSFTGQEFHGLHLNFDAGQVTQYRHRRHCMIPSHCRVTKHVEKMAVFDVLVYCNLETICAVSLHSLNWYW